MAVTSQYPQFMLVSASSDKIATNDETTNDPALLQVPSIATGSLDSEQFEKRQRRLSTASSLRTIETSSDAPTSSSTSLSMTSSATSFKSSTSLSSHHFSDPDPQDESEGAYQLKITPRSTYKDSRLVAGLGKGDNQPTLYGKLAATTAIANVIIQSPQAPDGGCLCSKPARVHAQIQPAREIASIEESYSDNSSRFRRALSQAMTSRSIKYRYNLNTYRMIPEGSDVMRYVKHGNLEKLKGCIESGEATIWDTAPDGWSLLHVSYFLIIERYLLILQRWLRIIASY